MITIRGDKTRSKMQITRLLFKAVSAKREIPYQRIGLLIEENKDINSIKILLT